MKESNKFQHVKCITGIVHMMNVKTKRPNVAKVGDRSLISTRDPNSDFLAKKSRDS